MGLLSYIYSARLFSGAYGTCLYMYIALDLIETFIPTPSLFHLHYTLYVQLVSTVYSKPSTLGHQQCLNEVLSHTYQAQWKPSCISPAYTLVLVPECVCQHAELN